MASSVLVCLSNKTSFLTFYFMKRIKKPKLFSQPYQCYMFCTKHYIFSSNKLIVAVLSKPPSSSKCIYTKIYNIYNATWGEKPTATVCATAQKHRSIAPQEGVSDTSSQHRPSSAFPLATQFLIEMLRGKRHLQHPHGSWDLCPV